MWSVRSNSDVHEWKRLTRAKVENGNRQEFGTGGISKNFVKDWTKWRKEDKYFCASVFRFNECLHFSFRRYTFNLLYAQILD